MKTKPGGRSRELVAAAALWAVVAGGGLASLAAHGARAGEGATAPAAMPAELAAALQTRGHSALVVIAHPACPCTRATLTELSRLLLAAPGTIDVVVLFSGTARGDRIGDELRRSARALPGARVIDDPERKLASSFGARTSGTVLFYDAGGELRFAGGITASRGHEGESAGGDALRRLLAPGGAPSRPTAPVYGCALGREGAPT